MSTVERIAGELNGRRSGKGWMVCCPAHDDRTPSLSIGQGTDGKILVKCFAGCAQERVLAALKERGLWTAHDVPAQFAAKSSTQALDNGNLGPPPAGAKPPAGLSQSHWVYRSDAAYPLFIVERIDGAEGKQFRPWSWDLQAQAWVNCAWPSPRPLYGLELLSVAPRRSVLIVEGEKSATAARELVGDHYVVVTWANGANAVATADWSSLQGRSVVIWPDADEPGVKAANTIAEVLRSICPEISLIDLTAPDAFTRNVGFDAADALSLGWKYQDFCEWAEPRMKLAWRQAQFENVAESIAQARAAREMAQTNRCETGIRFLDKALGGGIATGDVLLLAAPSGAGKTETALYIATHNAALGRRVHFFALEAERHELTQRLLYREIAELYFQSKVLRTELLGRRLNFADWMDGRYGTALVDLEEQAESVVREKYKTLNVYYRDREFGTEELRSQVLAVMEQTDLLVCDHVHQVDLPESENENRAMTELIKTIRDIALLSQKPFIVVAHVRKRDSRSRSLLPDLDDIHGTSNLAKIATKAVMLAPCYDSTQKPGEYFTYMRVVKNRRDGGRSRYAAVCTFDASKNRYLDQFILGRISSDGQKFEPLQDTEMPHWVKDY